MKRLRLFLGACLVAAVGMGCAYGRTPVKVEISASGDGYELRRGGMPYVVRGAGIGVDSQDAHVLMGELKRRGGNSFRTWNVGDGAFLDVAHELGLTVALCLDIARERHGFDYGDPEAVARQFNAARETVLKHRDHPALLAWVIGNELNHDYTDSRVYDAVNAISQMIHELDPNHPTTTTTAGINAALAADLNERAPDLDFISVQVYGGLFDLAAELEGLRLDKPVLVSEWGTIGHWEVPTTDWGAPIELNSSEKAATYRKGHSEVLSPLGNALIGSYAFLWGQKQERTPTWYGVFLNGEATEAADELQMYWTGQAPSNRAPRLTGRGLLLDGGSAADSVRLLSGRDYVAEVAVSDPEGRRLRYAWQILEESRATQAGGDPEDLPEDYSAMLISTEGRTATIRATAPAGAYRLFVSIHDDAGSVAHANIPFYLHVGE